MDGNFQAEHIKMRNPENDVLLSDGTRFMVSKKPYAYKSHPKSVLVVKRQQAVRYLMFRQKIAHPQTETTG